MRFSSVQRWAAVSFAVALSACAGNQGMVPSQSAAAALMPQTEALLPGATDAGFPLPLLEPDKAIKCDFGSTFWSFGGPCLEQAVTKSGGTFALGTYKGLKAEVKMSASNAKAGAIFVVGEGTSDADITGTYAGAKFPLFASKGAPCYAVTAKGSDKPAKCVGKGFLYMIVTNQGKSTVTFKGTPAVTISGKLPGTKRCEIDGLVSAGAKGKFGWAMLPIYGVPKAGSVAFASAPSTLAFKSGSAYIFGYSCE